MKNTLILLATMSAMLCSLSVYAVPGFLKHQGHILQSNNTPVTGAVNTTFKIYSVPENGSPVWTQTTSVAYDNGYYSITLGPGTPDLSSNIFDGSDLYLGVTLEGEAEFAPRHKITTAPYAFRAGSVTGEIEALGGLSVDGQEIIDSSGNLNVPGTISVDGQEILDSTGNLSVEELEVAGILVAQGPIALAPTNLSDLPSASEDNQGQIVYVTDENAVYYSNGSEWISIAGSVSSDISLPIVSSINPPQIEPGTDITMTITGQNFLEGCEVKVGDDWYDVTYVNANQVTIEIGAALSSGTYDLRFENPNGLRDNMADAIAVDTAPEWVTEAGSLGLLSDEATGNHYTLEANDAEGQNITYEIISGSFPPGLSLDNNTGVISGNPDEVEDDIEYTFEVRATDTAPTPNNVDRTFSIVITDMIGQTADAPGDSCKHILDVGSSTGDGNYWINPTGSSPMEVFCDMSTDGGGWTMLSNNDNADAEASGCITRVSAYPDDVCGGISYSQDFTVNAEALPFTEAVWAAYTGAFDIQSYQYMIFNSSQSIPTSSTWSLHIDQWNQTLSDYSSLPVIMCTTSSYNRIEFIRLQTTQGGILSRNTVFSATANETEMSFTEQSGQTNGLDDWQDGHGCSDQWAPQQHRGYSTFVMVR